MSEQVTHGVLVFVHPKFSDPTNLLYETKWPGIFPANPNQLEQIPANPN